MAGFTSKAINALYSIRGSGKRGVLQACAFLMRVNTQTSTSTTAQTINHGQSYNTKHAKCYIAETLSKIILSDPSSKAVKS